MINTKKLIGLGLLAAVGANFVLAPAVSAATGSTDFVYSPGNASGGGNGDGNGDVSTAEWTISYPVKVEITDANISSSTAAQFKFSLKDFGKDTAYTGSKTVKVTPVASGSTEYDQATGTFKMVGLESASSKKVSVQLMNTSNLNGTNTDIASLNKTTATSTGKAYITDKAQAASGENYKGTIIWNIVEGENA